MAEPVLEVGSVVLFEDDIDSCRSGIVVAIDGKTAKITLDEDGTTEDVPTEKISVSNPRLMDGVEDMTELSFLHNAALVHNIRFRFKWRLVYCFVGHLLIAVNPYERLKILGEAMINVYRANDGRDEENNRLAPHPYYIAQQCYSGLTRDKKSQSIVISGESGAGKTETTKIMMQFCTFVGRRADGSGGNLEQEILDTNPILEAFGNAKTVRNDNSSRFGKYVQINFTADGYVAGANTKVYLLEKSRLVFQAQHERNYHIFYQLCAGATDSQKAEWRLKPPSEYHYLDQSGCIELPSINDQEEFALMVSAMNTVGLTAEQQTAIFRLLSALLSIGNIDFTGGDAAQVKNTDALKDASSLLGVSDEGLSEALCKKHTKMGLEMMLMDRKADDAALARDALSKTMYKLLFDFLVERINAKLCKQADLRFVGVLDIFGFESFQKNSFEQLCINFANEKLQTFFNHHVFEEEQAEYVREKIEWTYVAFESNVACLELIENKGGILAMLDEECKVPNGKEENFIEKVENNNKANKHFKMARFKKDVFVVVHFAGEVQYDIANFLEKNNDMLHEDLSKLMMTSSFEFVPTLVELGKPKDEGPPKPGVKKKAGGFVSVANSFKLQLKDLMDTLTSTAPYFVRCVKPNALKSNTAFNSEMTLHQLKCGGIVSAVKVCQAGLPTRSKYEELYERYKICLPRGPERPDDAKKGMQLVLNKAGLDSANYRFGATKLFFRTGQLALVEDFYNKYLKVLVLVLQKSSRGMLHRRRYKKIKDSMQIAWTGQRLTRCLLACTRFRAQRQAAYAIESGARRLIAVRALETLLDQSRASRALQAHLRRSLCRATFTKMWEEMLEERRKEEEAKAAAEAEAKRLAEEEAKRKAEEEAKRKAEEEEALKKAAAEGEAALAAAKQKQAEEDAARLAAEKKAADEAAAKKAADEASAAATVATGAVGALAAGAVAASGAVAAGAVAATGAVASAATGSATGSVTAAASGGAEIQRQELAAQPSTAQPAPASTAQPVPPRQLARFDTRNTTLAFTDIGQVSLILQPFIQALGSLGLAKMQDDQLRPSETMKRRELAGWIFRVNNSLFANDPMLLLHPAINSGDDPLAFDDVPASDGDYKFIQGLAEAGLVPSKLMSDDDGANMFRPDADLTRGDLLLIKAAVDCRNLLEVQDDAKGRLAKAWGYKDAAKINPDHKEAAIFDYSLGAKSSILRAFGKTPFLQSGRSVSRMEALAALWFIGGGGENPLESGRFAGNVDLTAPQQRTDEAKAKTGEQANSGLFSKLGSAIMGKSGKNLAVPPENPDRRKSSRASSFVGSFFVGKPQQPAKARRGSVDEFSFQDLLFRSMNEDFSRLERMAVVHLPGNDSKDRPVLLIIGKNVPATNDLDMIDLYAYLIGQAERISKGPYVVVYIGTNATADNRPGPASMKKLFQQLPHRYRKNIQGLFLVEPSKWQKATLWVLKPLFSEKFAKKLHFVEKPTDMWMKGLFAQDTIKPYVEMAMKG